MTGSLTETLHTAVARAVGHEAEGVRALREYNEQQRHKDPSKIAWPATLPIELALKTASPPELMEHYGYTLDEWMALKTNPVFIAELEKACNLVRQDGMSFKLKCKMQAEELLETGWRLIHAPNSEVPPAVKEKLMAGVYRMAGFDNKDVAAAGGGGFNIQINFGRQQAVLQGGQ